MRNATGLRDRLYPALRVVFAIAGLSFLVVALNSAIRDPDLTVMPNFSALVVAMTLVVVGLWAAVAGWSRLLGSSSPRLVARGFLVAQLGKYVPGGIWQVLGQVGHASTTTGAGGRQVTLAYLVSVVTQVTAGLLVGIPAVAVADVPWWVRMGVVGAAAVAVALILDHRRLTRLLLALPWIRQAEGSDQHLMPPRAAVVFATATGALTMTAAGAVFVVAYQAPAGDYLAAAGPAYALAWTIGFLAIPFPAGLGVREAALVLLLPGQPATAIVAASAVVRVIYIVGELVAIATSFVPVTLASAGSAGPDDEIREQADRENQQPGDEE